MPHRPRRNTTNYLGGEVCSIARALENVGERWTLLIIREAFRDCTKFADFRTRLDIAPNILSTRLNSLVGAGIFEERRYEERPVRHEYLLTDKGRDLYPVLISLMAWGDRWAAGDDGPPLTLMHGRHRARPHLVCGHCDAEIDSHNTSTRVGPGLLALTST